MITYSSPTSAYIWDNGRMVEYINLEETLEDRINRQAYERDKELNPQFYQ